MPVSTISSTIPRRPRPKEHLHQRADEIFQTLFDTEVIETEDRKDGGKDYYMTLDMPDDFALDQPLSPFLLAALELLDPGPTPMRWT